MSKQAVVESGDNGAEKPKPEDADAEQSDWSITFEQFIASFLNESALVGKTIHESIPPKKIHLQKTREMLVN